MRLITQIGVGHHPFSKKFEFKGYFDEPTPALIATDYKAPKTVLELWGTGQIFEKESVKLTNNNREVLKQKPFTYVSIFSGIGGFEQALNKLGGTCVLASEIDKFAAQSYETLYGHKPEGDITKIDANDVPEHDLLVGGFPCQAFSVAGKRGGFEDARGTLFFEVARIAKEKQPKALLLENVKGLVGHDKGKTLDTIIKTLNDIGYRVDFEVLNSKFFGVPQNRERIFIVAVREDLVDNEAWTNVKGATVVPKGKRRISGYTGDDAWELKTFNFEFPANDKVTTRLRDILESNVDEKYYLDEDKTAKLVAQLEKKDKTVGEEVLPINVLSRGAESKTDGTSYCLKAGRQQELVEPQIDVVGRLELSKNDRTNRVHSVYGISPTPSGLGQGGGTEPKIAEPQMLGHVDIKGNDSIKRVYSGVAIREATKKGYAIAEEGESVNVQFPDSKTRRGRVGKQIANTLEASSINQGVVESPPKYRIRKLTPLECWRLQGFSDDAHEAVKQAGLSDSQRYRQAGNAITVQVVEALGKKLLEMGLF